MGGDKPYTPQRPPTPRWVKVFAVGGAVLLLFVILKLTGIAGEGHGPGRHGPGQQGGAPAVRTFLTHAATF